MRKASPINRYCSEVVSILFTDLGSHRTHHRLQIAMRAKESCMQLETIIDPEIDETGSSVNPKPADICNIGGYVLAAIGTCSRKHTEKRHASV